MREWWLSDEDDPQVPADAVSVLVDHRASFNVPLAKATMGLRSMVKTERCRVEVSQRLKRELTIVAKLARQPTMALSKMQDIAGCRAVLDSIDEVRRVQKRLSKNRNPIKVYDYISTPRPSGYRGVHLIIEYDGRLIEVQLRTRVMHDWAITVERLGGRIDEDLKSGQGPAEVLALLEAISEAMAIEETGGTVDTGLKERIDRLREQADPYLKGGRA